MPSTSLDPLSLGAHDKRPKATCELVTGDNVDPNLLEKRQSQYEASDEESKKKECEKETSPSDPAAALKSDIFHRFSFLLTPLFALFKLFDRYWTLNQIFIFPISLYGCTNPLSCHLKTLLLILLLSRLLRLLVSLVILFIYFHLHHVLPHLTLAFLAVIVDSASVRVGAGRCPVSEWVVPTVQCLVSRPEWADSFMQLIQTGSKNQQHAVFCMICPTPSSRSSWLRECDN